jgi:hypothetical protein
VTQHQNAQELTRLEARRAQNETRSSTFEAWLNALDRIRVRVGSGALSKTEKKLSLAAMAVIEEELERSWRSLQADASGRRGGDDLWSCGADRAREQILDELVKLRVALTASLNQAAGPNE